MAAGTEFCKSAAPDDDELPDDVPDEDDVELPDDEEVLDDVDVPDDDPEVEEVLEEDPEDDDVPFDELDEDEPPPHPPITNASTLNKVANRIPCIATSGELSHWAYSSMPRRF